MKIKNNIKEISRWSFVFVKPFLLPVFLLMLFSLAGSYAATFEPHFAGKIIDSLTQKDKNAFLSFLKIGIAFQFAGLIFSILNSLFQFLLQRKITIYTESRLYINLLYLPPKGYTEKDSGKFLNIFLSDISAMIGIYTAHLPAVISSLIIMSVIGFRLFKIDILLFFLTVIVSVVPVFLARYFGKKQAQINEVQKKYQDKYTYFISETIGGLQEIKNSFSQKFFINNFKNILFAIFDYVKKSAILGMYSSTASFASNFFINTSLFILVGISVLKGHNSVGTITAALMYSNKFRSLASSCAEVYKAVIISFISAERIKSFFYQRQKQNTAVSVKKDDSGKKQIIIENFSFKYKEGTDVLKNINLQFYFPGLYLIKGSNGSGKTTLLDIISENIVLNGTARGSIIFLNLKKPVSYVNQNPFVFSGTIYDNLIFGKTEKETELQNILMQTQLCKVLSVLPEGLLTKLGGNGHILSQGQIQRLALSRCLLKNTEIILFDEIENALDKDSSENLTELLTKLKTQKLILMVTHKDTYDKIATDIFTINS